MKEGYEQPKMEVVVFKAADVLTASAEEAEIVVDEKK